MKINKPLFASFIVLALLLISMPLATITYTIHTVRFISC